MITNQILLASALLLANAQSNASEKIHGKYQTVTESECNFTLVLSAKGHGSFTKSCRLEDGTHKDVVEKRTLTWKARDNAVIVTGLDAQTEVFTIHRALSCQSFGGTGSAFGLRGYGSIEFWKSPQKCK